MYIERFLTLKQKNLTVKEYMTEFNKLARFGLELVNTPHKKALRFAKGLNEPLHSLAMSHIPMGATYEKLVDMAYMREEEKGVSTFRPQDKKEDPKKAQQQKKGGKEKRKCHNCGIPGHLKKDCRKKKKFACYHCGDAGHAVKGCPKK